jgi:hypothetical protein
VVEVIGKTVDIVGNDASQILQPLVLRKHVS